MKKTWPVLFSLLLLAASADVQAQFTYTTNNGVITLTQYTGGGGAVVISNFVNIIGTNAFSKTAVTSVTISNSVTSIGEYAFYECTNLASVTIPNSVTNIGADAFFETAVTSVTIPKGVANIANDAFESCSNLSSVAIPDSVTNIGIGAFSECSSLAGVTIPNSVTSIGNSAFDYCTNLASVTIPGSVTNFGETAFAFCSGLTNVIISNGVTSIGIEAFELCTNLASVTIDNGVISIGINAFAYCTSLASVKIGTNVTSIGDNAFYHCVSLTNVTIPNSVTSIEDSAFEYCASLTGVTIPNSVTSIGDDTFAYCSNLASVTIGTSVTNMGWAVFAYCTNLASVTIDNGVTSLGESMFAFCASLTNVTIPASVTHIGQYAFADCTNLTALYFQGAPPSADCTVFIVSYGYTNLINATVYYLPKATGWGSTFACIATALGNPPAGALQVAITPASAVKAGAQWQVDGGVWETNGAVVSGLSAETNHTLAFKVIYGWTTPSNQLVTITSGTTTTNTGVYAPQKVQDVTLAITSPKPGQSLSLTNNLFTVTGTARDTLTAKDHVAVESVYYQLNGGSWTLATPVNSWSNWTASVTLSNGANTISAYAVDTSSNASPITKVAFKYIPSATLVVSNNGNGTFSPKDNGALLAIGTNYTLTASAGKNWIFSNWVAGGGANFVSNNPVLKFTMQPNLTLTANFVTNVFLAAQGTYNGLFAPTNAPRRQTNSGAITFKITSVGVVSGKLTIGTNTPSLNGQFDPSGAATLTTTRKGLSTLTTTLKLDFDGQTASGSITDGSFVALVMADLEQKATHYDGQYTLILPGADEQAAGPLGTSCGTVTVKSGAISFGGYLADGTSVSQSSYVSTDGYWPFYLSLYGGNGSLWSWNCFTNTNGAMIIFSTNASWINATNTSKTALYRTGFTNQAASIVGSAYNATDKPLLALTNGQVMLKGGNLPATIANRFTLTSKNAVILTNAEDTNKLTLTINKSTGVISGSFANPAKPKQTIKVNGVILQGQTNAQGYFLGTNQSGTFMLMPQ